MLESVFGLLISDIRISSIINDSQVKAQLLQAETYIDDQEYLKAIVCCRNAFENAKFKKQNASLLTLLSIPTILETQKDFDYMSWFLKQLTNEFEVLKLGVDSRIYQRFMEYVHHIPIEYKADRSPSGVMQRDWNREDALFCYTFVSDCAYKWEVMDLQPLYNRKEDDGIMWNKCLGSVELTTMEPGAIYAQSDSVLHLYYVDTPKCDEIRRCITEGKTYTYRRIPYVNGVRQEQKFSSEDTVRSISTQLVTNDPVRWQVLIDVKS